MINTSRVLKASAVWISLVYAVCYLGVALFPGIRPGFMQYGLHMGLNMGENILTLGTFISGLVIWNVIAFLAVGLFAFLYNKIK
ncbi:MAG: hypothetical protein FJY98_00085 [Candidatus Liptonbacteria bacterium]|nr:hypothetical protein [Candidatus Liptonbacteria bacterium]